jgi:cell wall-associated NlpC family hydrolase
MSSRVSSVSRTELFASGRQSLARRIALVSAAAVVAVGVFVTPAGASTINTSTKVRACTNLGDNSCGVTYATLYAGTSVTMRCWRDESAYAGTVRWFWVAGGGVEGFVSANYVSSQSSVRHCNEYPHVQAARWAGTKLLHTDYDGWCLRFVRLAWSYAAKDIGSADTAYLYWRSNPKGYAKYGGDNPPVGALVFWGPTAGYREGHVAISIGAGRAISTYERSYRGVHVMVIKDRNQTHPYLGYMTP